MWIRVRLLKRAIAREMFKHLTAPCPIDDYSDLRPTRQARNITPTSAAAHCGVWPNHDTLAANYRRWLNTEVIDAA